MKMPMRSATSHNLFKPCPSPAGGVVRGAEEEGLNHHVVLFKRPPMPRNARNGAESHGFCAAVPEDAKAPYKFESGSLHRRICKLSVPSGHYPPATAIAR
jgi:hypothetical protein